MHNEGSEWAKESKSEQTPPPGAANYSQEKEDTAHNNSGKGKLLLPPPYLKSTPQNKIKWKKIGFFFSLSAVGGGQTRSSGDSDHGDGSFCILFYFSLVYFILFGTFSSSPPPEKENETDGIIQKKEKL